MHACAMTLVAFGVAVMVSSSALGQFAAGDALVTIFCSASIAAGSLLAITRHHADETVTTLNLI